jgi:hypothetical protein
VEYVLATSQTKLCPQLIPELFFSAAAFSACLALKIATGLIPLVEVDLPAVRGPGVVGYRQLDLQIPILREKKMAHIWKEPLGFVIVGIDVHHIVHALGSFIGGLGVLGPDVRVKSFL